jgi:hypothetical protein
MRKVTVSFVMSVRLSAWNNSVPAGRILIKFYIWIFFENLPRKFKFHQNMTRITGTLLEYQYTLLITSLWILLRTRNVSDKSCRESQNTGFVGKNPPPPPPKSCRLWDNVGKYGRAGQATDVSIARRMHFARRKIKATATLRICNICCFFRATVVTRTLLYALFLNKIILILTGVSWVQIDIFMDPPWFVMGVFCWASLTQEKRGSACLLGTRSSCWWRVLVTLLITAKLHCM